MRKLQVTGLSGLFLVDPAPFPLLVSHRVTLSNRLAPLLQAGTSLWQLLQGGPSSKGIGIHGLLRAGGLLKTQLRSAAQKFTSKFGKATDGNSVRMAQIGNKDHDKTILQYAAPLNPKMETTKHQELTQHAEDQPAHNGGT